MNEMEWNEWNGMEWNEWNEWNEMEWNDNNDKIHCYDYDYNPIFHVIYSRNDGFIQISGLENTSPDIHLSPASTLMQLLNPRSSPI